MRIPNCKGSCHKRKDCNKWIIKYPLGWNTEKQVYDYYQESLPSQPDAIVALKDINEFIYFGGTKTKKAITIMRKQKQIDEFKETEESLISFNEFAIDFINSRYEQKQITARTYNDYHAIIKRMKPYIGHLPLNSINTKDIDDMYRQMMNPNNNKNLSKKAYTGATIIRNHSLLCLVFNHAIDYELLTKNPMEKVKKPKNDTKEKEFLSLSQAQSLYSIIMSKNLNSYNIGILIGLFTGVRLSEMLALTWNDYSNQTLHIHASLENEQKILKDTKTGEERYITCPQALTEILDNWKTQQKQHFKNKLHLSWSQSTPIVNSRQGDFILQSSYRGWLRYHKKDYGLPNNFHFHELRHTYITLLCKDCRIDEKTTRVLSGHKSTAFKIYTHTDEEYCRKATDALNNIITSPTSSNKISKCCQFCKHWASAPNKEKGTCWLTNSGNITSATHTCNNFK